MRRFSLFLAFVQCAAIGGSAASLLPTDKDTLICKMILDFKNMDACVTSSNFNKEVNIETDEAVAVFKECKERIVGSLTKYSDSLCGLANTNFWMAYLHAECVSTMEFADYEATCTNFAIVNVKENSLMKLAQDMATESAAIFYTKDALKLSLFRNGEACEKYFRAVTMSATLNAPMLRALTVLIKNGVDKADDIDFVSALNYEIAVAQNGCFFDEQFFQSIAYLSHYIKYEVKLSKRRPKVLRDFPALKHADSDEVARSLMATVLVNQIVVPFLAKNLGDLSLAYRISGMKHLSIDFKEKMAHSAVAEEWRRFVELGSKK